MSKEPTKKVPFRVNKRYIDAFCDNFEYGTWSRVGEKCGLPKADRKEGCECKLCVSAMYNSYSFCCGVASTLTHGVRTFAGKTFKEGKSWAHQDTCKLDFKLHNDWPTLHSLGSTGQLPGGIDPSLYNDFQCVACQRAYPQAVVGGTTSAAIPEMGWLCAICLFEAKRDKTLSGSTIEALAKAVDWKNCTRETMLYQIHWCCGVYRRGGTYYRWTGQKAPSSLYENGHLLKCVHYEKSQDELDRLAAGSLRLPGGMRPWNFYRFFCAKCHEWEPRSNRTDEVYWMCKGCASGAKVKCLGCTKWSFNGQFCATCANIVRPPPLKKLRVV